jgi:hypothetical protein
MLGHLAERGALEAVSRGRTCEAASRRLDRGAPEDARSWKSSQKLHFHVAINMRYERFDRRKRRPEAEPGGADRSSGDGTRTHDLRIMRPGVESPNGQRDKGFGPARDPVAPYLPPDTCRGDFGLVSVIDSWPTLPEPIRAAILALVRASSKDGGGR